jgi:uncharacterized protein YggE
MNLSLKSKIFVGFIAVGLVIVLIFSVSNLTTPRPVLAAEATQALEAHTINVAGEGKLSVTPDVAYVSIALVTKANTAKEAQSKNAAGFSKVQKV